VINTDLIDDKLAYFYDKPYEFVIWAFPWGEKGTVLEQEDGPRTWQKEYLLDMGREVKSRGFDKKNAVEPIQFATASGHGIGKAHKTTDMLPTLDGMESATKIKAGYYLFGENGSPVKVLAKKRYSNIPFYRVTFNDGSSEDVSSGHLWKVRGRNSRRTKQYKWEVLSTLEILNKGVKRKNGKCLSNQWEIPIAKAVEYWGVKPEVDAYSYGVWLGDGCKRSCRITNQDAEVWDNLPYDLADTDNICKTAYGLKRDLRNNGLYGCTTYNASVDKRYKHIAARLHVLQGLLDTDGWVEKSGGAGFASASKKLTTDVIEIARSLGLRASQEKFKPNKCSGSWNTYITWDGKMTLFRIKRKQDKLTCPKEERYHRKWIERIEPIGNFNGICFSVEGELYQTKNFNVTHNSCLTSWIILWTMATRPYCKGTVTANTSDQLNAKTWSELAKWHHLFLLEDNFTYRNTRGNMVIYQTHNKDEWFCKATTCKEENSEAFAGQHAANSTSFYIMDEGSAVPDKIYEVAKGGLTDGESHMHCFGNPTRNSGAFREMFSTQSHRWITRSIDSRTVEGAINMELADQWEEDYGEDSDFFRVRVKGMFPSAASNQLIPTDLVEYCAGRHLREEQYSFAPKIIGVDVARYGGDSSVISLRQGLFLQVLNSYKSIDLMTLANMVAQYEDDNNANAVFIDVGMGAGTIDRLRQLGRSPVEVAFGGKSTNKQCLNKRAQMWWEFKEWMESGGSIPNDPVLKKELIQQEYFFNAHDKIQLVSKEDMKRIGLDSPDTSDSCVLTVAESVKGQQLQKDDIYSRILKSQQTPNKSRTDFDIFR